MEEIVPNTDNIDIEGQTSNSVFNMGEGPGNSDTEEHIANFISEELTSQWFIEFKTTIERHEVREVRNEVLVRKLPACYRVPLEQYTPKQWHFGLHNRDVLHPSESEDLKIALAAASELGPWDEFCVSVVDDPLGVLRAYGLDHTEPKFSMRQAYPQGELEKCPHILACVYRIILCGQNLKRQSGATRITIQSATALKKAGIQIKGIEGVLDEVGFRKRCLFLPIVKLYDQTESFFRNLANYEYMEEYNSFKCPFGEYLQLMTSLIKEVGDVKHLLDCDVIQNELCTDNNAFEMWNSLQSRLPLRSCSKEYEDMVFEINKQCKSSLNVMRTEFYQLFCSRPWYVIAVITATIVTIGTCIQAYTSVIGSDKMQPHFPP
ncbi:unnamed protein product [Sphagnum troendelagicum]